MTTFGDQVFQYGGAAVSGPLSTGPAIYIKPGTGSDGASGKRPDRSLKTLSKAQTLIAADKNGVIYLVSEDNSASGTTARISDSSFTFSKDGVKIQGINQNGMIGQRSRISNTSGIGAITPLMTWSANNSSMANVHVLYSEANASAKGCFDVTGDRNYFYRCHFAGIASATQDVADAYSLKVTGSENLFEECVIGIDTTDTGTGANYELTFTAAATAARNIFKNCIFLTYATAVGQAFVNFASTGIERFVLFDNCTFINAGIAESPGSELDTAFIVDANPGGSIILKDCCLIGAVEWDTTDSGKVFVLGANAIPGSAGALTSGVAVEPT